MRKFWISAAVIGYLGGLLLFWYDSLNSCCLLSLAAIIPIKTYSNAEADKAKILSDNKNKSGIYKWKNNNNGKQYIGSAVDLPKRLKFYYSNSSMKACLKRSQSHKCNALLKHGRSNFSVEILEYCEPEKCLEREAFYQTKLKPEYNISLNPSAPMYGRNHSDETKQILSDAKKGEKNPMFGRTGENHPNFGKPKP